MGVLVLVISLCETTSSSVTGLYFSTLRMSDASEAELGSSHHGKDSASAFPMSTSLPLPFESVGKVSDMRTSSSEFIVSGKIAN